LCLSPLPRRGAIPLQRDGVRSLLQAPINLVTPSNSPSQVEGKFSQSPPSERLSENSKTENLSIPLPSPSERGAGG